MHRIGYSLVSNLAAHSLTDTFYSIDPDDGTCNLCAKPGPVVHIIEDGPRQRTTILDICERCTKRIVETFSWGNEA